MEYRGLGRSGLKVSPLCLGTMMFGGATDDADGGARIVDRAREQGVNFIDTADGYNGGKSEEVVGRAIRGAPVVVGAGDEMRQPDGAGARMRAACRGGMCSTRWRPACAASVSSEIDVLYLHKEDHTTPLAETVHALADLIRAGKIRYFGVSNYRSWRVAEICRLCDEAGIDRPVASQPLYNALNREVETEHLPACGYFGLGVVPYSPLARGVLTGKYAPGAAAGGDPRRAAGPADAGIGMAAGKPA